MINTKICRRCKKPYDIGTNYDTCPKCRGHDDPIILNADEVEWR